MSGYVINLTNLDVGAANRELAINAISNNILGIRDVLALMGAVPGWNKSISGGPEEPSRIMFSNTEYGTTEWVAITDITYASGNMTYAKYMYSNDSTTGLAGSGTWYGLADSTGKYICTYTYDVNGDLESTTWS